MCLQLKDTHERLNITTLHVTHDFEEAMSLADNIVVINQGKIVQVGKPSQIFYHPASEFVARFTMARNIFKGKVIGRDSQGSVFRTEALGIIAAVDNNNASAPCDYLGAGVHWSDKRPLPLSSSLLI